MDGLAKADSEEQETPAMYLSEHILDTVYSAHAMGICYRDMVGSDSHDWSVILVHTHILSVHVPVPDCAQFPEIREARYKRAGDLSQASSIAC